MSEVEMREAPMRVADAAALAAIDAGGAWSWRRLGRVVAALAAEIDVRCGPLPGVAVYGSHGAAVYAAIVAALSRGGRIVFLDPATETTALRPLLAALGVSIVLDGSGRALAGMPGLEVVVVPPADAEASPGASLAPEVSCRDYAILTSGTSGEPKVILQSLANLRAHIANYAGYVGVRPGDRVLQLASAGWDAGLMDVFSCLFHGGVLCSLDPRTREVGEVRQFIAGHALDILHITVPYFRLLHADPEARYPAPIRMVLGGELIHRHDLERFERVAPAGSTLFNAYGPTECTTALYARHRHGLPLGGPTWPLAHGVDGVVAELAGSGGLVQEPGILGELVLRSVLLAGRFDPAARAMLGLDTLVVDGERYYPTGDLAYRDSQGRVVITGRTDIQIKVNGQKVSLLEVEAVLRSMSGVADACVLARRDDRDAVVVAAVVPGDAGMEEAVLRRALAERLPAHKLPKQLLLLPALPLGQNQKIDRARILALAEEAAAAAAPMAADDEPLIAEVLKALGGAAVDRALSFLDNGGDSLRALSVVAALKRRGHRLALEALMSRTPVGELLLAGQAPAGPRAAAAGPAALPNRAFLTSRGIPDLDRWCQTAVFDHTGGRHAGEVAAVLRTVLARHAAGWPGGQPAVETLAPRPLRAVVAAMEERISLDAGRACAAGVVAGERGLHLVVACHQLYVDRMSWILLLGELADGTREGAAAVRRWPRPSPDLAEWASLHERFRGAERSTQHWAGLPWDRCAELVPAGVAFPPRNAFARASFELGALGGWAGAGAPLRHTNHALLAAVLMALADATGNRWQKLDLLEHGRDLTIDGLDPHGIFGWLTAIYPLVMQVEHDHSAVVRALATYLERVKPLAHALDHGRTAGQHRRCDASYNFLGDLEIAATAEYSVNPLAMETMHGAASHHLELTGYVSRGRVRLTVDYDRGVFEEAAIARLGAAIAGAFPATPAPALPAMELA